MYLLSMVKFIGNEWELVYGTTSDDIHAASGHTNCLLHLKKMVEWERQGDCGERDCKKTVSKQNIGLL